MEKEKICTWMSVWATIVVIMLAAAIWALAFAVSHAKIPALRFASLGIREITSYRAVTAECDAEPDIGAYQRVAIKGKPTGHWAACNWLPYKTKIIIPSITSDTVWMVADKMNPKVGHRIDLLLPIGQTVGLKHAEVFICRGK